MVGGQFFFPRAKRFDTKFLTASFPINPVVFILVCQKFTIGSLTSAYRSHFQNQVFISGK